MGDDDRKHCPVERTCALYGMFRLAGMEGLWKSLYCHGAYERCRRYELHREGKPIPRLMLPDGKLLTPRRPSEPPKAE